MKVIDFYILTLFLYLAIITSYFQEFFIFILFLSFPYKQSCHLQTKMVLFYASQSIYLSFPFKNLIVLARTSSTVFNWSGERGHSCLLSYFKGKASSFLPLSIMLSVGVFFVVFF